MQAQSFDAKLAIEEACMQAKYNLKRVYDVGIDGYCSLYELHHRTEPFIMAD